MVSEELEQLVACGVRVAFMIDGHGNLLGAAGDTQYVDTTALAALAATDASAITTRLRDEGACVLGDEGARMIIVVARFRLGSALLVGLEPTDASLMARMHDAAERMAPKMKTTELPPLDLDTLFE